MIERATPKGWRASLEREVIEVLPLVDADRGSIGWCTDGQTLEGPDIEVFCGGINTKQPTHTALWRHGNLMHFGFEPSPAELNEAGRALLLNSIEYIARFTEDRPIAVMPSPLSKRPWVMGRRFVDRILQRDDATAKDVARFFASPWQEELAAMSVDEAKASVRERFGFARCAGRMLGFDQDALDLGIPIDAPDYIARMRAALASGDERVLQLLARTIPSGPREPADEDVWGAWLREKGDYLFYCAGAGYVWLLDPLAERRGIPSSELRGPRRADFDATEQR
jgi:hypothetical protein